MHGLPDDGASAAPGEERRWSAMIQDDQRAAPTFWLTMIIGLGLAALALVPVEPHQDRCGEAGVVFDAACALAGAEITLEGQPPCEPIAGQRRNRCGQRPWQWVGRAAASVGPGTLDGLWVHAAPSGRRLRLYFRDVPLAGKLVGRFGLAASAGVGSPVMLQVRAAGADVLLLESADELSARAFAVDLPGDVSRGDLEISVWARDDNRRMALLDLAIEGDAEEAP